MFGRATFTLVELLVVITIVSLLAAMLLPCLFAAKGKAKQITCVNNLRQLGHALRLYADDWEDVLPRPTAQPNDAASWFYAVDPYLLHVADSANPQPKQKVALIKQDPIWSTFDGAARTNWRTIKMNRKLVGNSSQGTSVNVMSACPSYRRITDVSRPSTTPLLFDGRCEEVPSSSPDRTRFDGWEVYMGRRHNGRVNVLFVDGHVESWSRGASNAAGGFATGTTTLDWWVP